MTAEKRPNVYGVSRDLWDHPAFADEPYTERQAWAWLIGATAWKAGEVRGPTGPLGLARGEFCHSLRFLSDKWGWSKSRVERFFGRLQNQDMIRDTSRDGVKIYSLNNYNRFQIVGVPTGTPIETPSGTRPGRDRDKEETGKQENRESSLRSDSKPAPKKRVVQNVLLLIPEWVPKNLWDGFVEMRQAIAKKSKGAPFTDEARRLLLLDLEKLRQAGHDPAAVLEQSIKKGYLGLFKPKEESNGENTYGRTTGRAAARRSSYDTFLNAAVEVACDAARGATEADGLCEDAGAAGGAPEFFLPSTAIGNSG